MSRFGRAFYRRELSKSIEDGDKTVLRRVEGRKVDDMWVMGEESVVPFWAGKELRWEIVEN